MSQMYRNSPSFWNTASWKDMPSKLNVIVFDFQFAMGLWTITAAVCLITKMYIYQTAFAHISSQVSPYTGIFLDWKYQHFWDYW